MKKGYRNNVTPTTYAIGLLEGIEDQDVREKAIANFDENYAVRNEQLYGGAATTSRALDYAFVWEDSPEGGEYWKKVYDGYRANRD